MGFSFKKIARVANPVGSIVGKSLGGDVGEMIGNPLSAIGGLGDLLMGKKVGDKTTDFTPGLTALRKKGVGFYSSGLDEMKKDLKAPTFVKGQVLREQEAVGQAAKDAKMRLKQNMASRGLGNTSIGIGAMMGADQKAARQKALIGATEKQRVQDELQKRKSRLMAASGNTLGIKSDILHEKGGVRGGLLPMVGAGVGAYFGGPAGAQMGGGIGSSLQQQYHA